MKLAYRISIIIILLISNQGVAQSITENYNRDTRYLLERYAVLNDMSQNASSIKPIRRDDAAEIGDSMEVHSKVDKYNKWMIRSSNFEYTANSQDLFSDHRFYSNKASLYAIDKPEKGIQLSINPILNFNYRSNRYYPERRTFYNRRGLRVRGIIANKVAFSTEVADIQERGPYQFDSLRNKYGGTVNGAGFYLKFKDIYGVDYLDNRVRINFNLLKDNIDFTMGYDKNFIGDGYRSLLLSENSNNYLFAKINVKWWKLRYESIYAQLIPDYPKSENLAPRKYSVMNYLLLDVRKNLSFGLFEGVVMKRNDHFDLMYLLPLIFLRSAERNIGSQDNGLIGGTWRWDIKKRGQLYGQFMLDEFNLNALKTGKENWRNKYGIQLGGKYFNAFGIENFDLQAEANWVRPFSYQHYTLSGDDIPIQSYTHYGQPLAHPLGAGFEEVIFMMRYQPIPKVRISATSIFYNQGEDSMGVNFGNNPMLSYNTRNADTDIKMINGPLTNANYIDVMTSYFFLPNVSLDASLMFRNQLFEDASLNHGDFMFTIGIRANTFARKYDY